MHTSSDNRNFTSRKGRLFTHETPKSAPTPAMYVACHIALAVASAGRTNVAGLKVGYGSGNAGLPNGKLTVGYPIFVVLLRQIKSDKTPPNRAMETSGTNARL